jgi:hypothetical protein
MEDIEVSRSGSIRGRWKRLALVLIMVAGARMAVAQTDEIQVYDAEIAAPGSFELTWHNNFIAHGAALPAEPDALVPDRSANGVTEWAYGVTHWFEAGLYLPVYTRTGSGSVLFDGFKLRALFVAPGASERRFIYGVNFEFSLNTRHWDPHRYTSEIRPIIGWHLGRLDVIFNPILDSAYDGLSNLRFAPATRVAYRLSKPWTFGIEEYDDFGPLSRFERREEQSHLLFGVVDYVRGRLAVEAGAGFGLPGGADHRVLKLILTCDLSGGPHQ